MGSSVHGFWTGFPRTGRTAAGERELQTENRAARVSIGNLDRTTMLLKDTVSHRQAPHRALARGLGGEVRIVDPMHVIGGDAVARIRDFDAGSRALRPGSLLQSSTPSHGIAGIQEQVQAHLLELRRHWPWMLAGGRSRLQIRLELDVPSVSEAGAPTGRASPESPGSG